VDTNPYIDPANLAELLWETELVADRYSNGDLILIRTRDGWRSFFGHFNPEALGTFEKTLDKRFPSYEMMLDSVRRMPNLVDEFHRLLPNTIDWFPGYRPMKMIDDLGEPDDS